MTKNCLFAVALVNVALWTGCAKGLGSTPSVTVSDGNISVVYVTQKVPFTATVTGTNNTAVNWSLSGKACTGSGNPCGTIDSNGVYTAPATAPAPGAVTIIATSQADSSGRGQLQITVFQVSVSVTPTPANVGQGLVQQFTAVAVPDTVPQTFTWAVTCGGSACGTLVQDTNVPGLAVYTAPAAPPTGCTTSSNCVQVTATSTIDATGVGTAKVLVLSSRFTASPYALRFSGYDNAHHPVEIAGSVTFAANGLIASGVEDVVSNGVYHQYTTVSGGYTPSTAGDDNTNNAGTLTLSASGAPTNTPNTYTAVVDAAGNLRMIESDGNGTGSGSMEKTGTQFNTAAQKFVFGFTGVDSNGRVGYVGLVPLTPISGTSGTINGGLLDVNDHGDTTTACGTSSCPVGGSYQADAIPGLWHMTLTTGITQHFDFFIGSGQANAKNPLTLYAISTDANYLALSGRMVLQDPGTTYDKTALDSDSVSHLTGVDGTGSNTLVSLVSATGDGNGNLSENFDANNAGTIVPAAAQNSSCTYTTGTGGRYVVTLLGTGSSCTGGLPFVFYASGKNRGFLLDQSSMAVMTGAMDPQTGSGTFAPSELPGTYAVGTVSNATSGVIPMVANLLLTSPGNQVYDVGGTQYPGPVAVTGTYTLMVTGTGTIALTPPAPNPAASYVIYATDTSHFEMIDVDTSVTNAAVIFAQQ